MIQDWLIVTSPLLIIGIPLLLFGDRNISHHRDNMRNGKEFIWQENFRPGLGNLVSELDDELDFGEEIIRLGEQFDDESQSDPEGIDSEEDIIRELCLQAPFTPPLREATDALTEHSQMMGTLEDDYDSLPIHLRKIGGYMIASWIVILIGGWRYGVESSNFVGVIILVGFLLFLAAGQGKRYLDRKDRLREYADKYEQNREI